MQSNQPNSKRPLLDWWWFDEQPWTLLDVMQERPGKSIEMFWWCDGQRWVLIVDGDDVYDNVDDGERG